MELSSPYWKLPFSTGEVTEELIHTYLSKAVHQWIETVYGGVFFDRKIHTSWKWGIFNQSVKFCYISMIWVLKFIRWIFIEIWIIWNWKLPKLKVAIIESCQNWKFPIWNLPKLKVAIIESCQNWKIPILKVAKVESEFSISC